MVPCIVMVQGFVLLGISITALPPLVAVLAGLVGAGTFVWLKLRPRPSATPPGMTALAALVWQERQAGRAIRLLKEGLAMDACVGVAIGLMVHAEWLSHEALWACLLAVFAVVVQIALLQEWQVEADRIHCRLHVRRVSPIPRLVFKGGELAAGSTDRSEAQRG